MRDNPDNSLWGMLAQFPLFILELLLHPRQLLRRMRWEDPASTVRLSLYLLLSLLLIGLCLSDTRSLAADPHPALSSFKGIIMRAHLRSFDWLSVVYAPVQLSLGQALQLWDMLLAPRFVAWTLTASVLAVATVARLRMLRYGLDWNHALGTGMLGLLGLLLCQTLALVPLGLLLVCRVCVLRLGLGIMLWLAGWFYLGYYSLADLGERPRGFWPTLGRSLLYGMLQAIIAGIIFLLLVFPLLPA